MILVESIVCCWVSTQLTVKAQGIIVMDQEPSLSPKNGIQTATGFTLVRLGLLVFVIGLTYFTSSLIKPSPDLGAQHIATFTGKDNGTTGSFVVKDDWEFRWTHNGDLEQIIWTEKGGH